jgi:Viral (Superfamily 1) RNA helicase
MMSYPILYQNELDVKLVEKSFDKTLKQLQAGDFNSADVRKMGNTQFYRARLDIRDRLLFCFVTYQGSTKVLLLEIIKNHNYAQSRFLRGAMLPDDDKLIAFDPKEIEQNKGLQELVYLRPKSNKVHFLNKFISFDEVQQSVLQLQAPLIIVGSAGSGKTALVLEKLKTLTGNVAYISLSKFLVENAANLYYSKGYNNEDQDVEFLSLTDYLLSWKKLEGKEVTFRQFDGWFAKHSQSLKITESYRVFEEFKGVISGTPTDTAYLTQQDYLALGVKQSIFSAEERTRLYPLYLKYVAWLQDNNYYDSNIICFNYLQHITPKYDYIMVDEVQDITNIQLKCILQSLNKPQNFILTGDSNQIVHPNFFSWSKVKSYFHASNNTAKSIQVLQTNYRNSKQVVDLSNNLLKIKNTRFGSIDRESNYLITTNNTTTGNVVLYNDDDKKKNELNKRTQHSTQFAVIVTDNILKEEAKKYFKTPLVFSVQEAKGLEYENVILVNFISNHTAEFKEIINGVSTEDLLQQELAYSRSANKNDKDAEIYKFYINSFYVAITRAIKNIYLFEKQIQHPALQLLQMQETKNDVAVAETKSTKEEWLEEARRLEEQGKFEQAEQIRAKYLGYDYVSQEDLEAMLPLALDPTKKEHEVKKERKLIFQYAVNHQKIEWIESLASLQFQRAILFMKEVKQDRKELAKDIRLGNIAQANRVIAKYGIDFCVEEGVNALMLAAYHGQTKMALELLQQKISVNKKDKEQKVASHYLIDGFFKTTFLKQQQCATLQTLKQLWFVTKPQTISYEIFDKRFQVNSNSMLFYLLVMMRIKEATQEAKCKTIFNNEPDKKFISGVFNMDDFEQLAALMPEEILPEFRKNRSYINSVVAANEVERYGELSGCKACFRRVKRGYYILQPAIVWLN